MTEYVTQSEDVLKMGIAVYQWFGTISFVEVSTAIISILICAAVCVLWSKTAEPENTRSADAKLVEEKLSAGQKFHLSMTQLRQFDGILETRLLIALQGIIYDVSSAPEFYGPSGGYHIYAGREAGRALGKMTLRTPQHDDDLENPWVPDLDAKQQKVLDDWIKLFRRKYPVCGILNIRFQDLMQRMLFLLVLQRIPKMVKIDCQRFFEWLPAFEAVTSASV